MQIDLPSDTLLARYAIDSNGARLPHYTDCFVVDVDREVPLHDFVRAFYTTPLFRSERLVLALAGLSSTDADIEALLAGRQQHFAAWTIEDRTEDQLLMCDVNQRTRSWFRVAAQPGASRLFFGSAVTATKTSSLPRGYTALLGLHRVYSRALLRAARRRLKRVFY